MRRRVVMLCLISFAIGFAIRPAYNRLRPPRPAGYAFAYRHACNLERAKAGGISVVFLGDSITEGLGAHPAWEMFRTRGAVNFGIPFDASDDVLRRVREGTAGDARVVVLMIGSNDLAAGKPVAEVVGNVKAILSELAGRHVVLLGVLPRAGIDPAPLNAELAKLPGFYAISGIDLIDGIHPSPAGYRAMATQLLPLLRE